MDRLKLISLGLVVGFAVAVLALGFVRRESPAAPRAGDAPPAVAAAVIEPGHASPVAAAATARASERVRTFSFVQPSISLGDVPWFTQVPFELQLVNTSAAPLTIETVKTDCGCTVVDAAEMRTVEAGETLHLTGTISTDMRTGQLERKVTAIASSGEEQTCKINLRVVATFSLSPTELTFSDDYREQVIQFVSGGAGPTHGRRHPRLGLDQGVLRPREQPGRGECGRRKAAQRQVGWPPVRGNH